MNRLLPSTGLAIALSLLAILLFDLMGLVIKLLSSDYAAIELSAYRNIVGLLPSGIALWLSADWHSKGRPVRLRQWQLALWRGVFTTAAQIMFYLSLGRLAFATAGTITYTNAFIMTALAVPLLGEKVGALRWSAVAVGFAGVVMVIGPNPETFNRDALLPLGAAFFYALSGVMSKMIDDDVPSALLNIYSTAISVVGAGALTIATVGFSPLRDISDLGWILAMGCFGGTAVLCLVISYRMTEQSNLAPFNYFGIPIAFVLGWLFFDEAPWGDLFPGALLIAGGGLLIVFRERHLRRRRLDQTTTSSASCAPTPKTRL
ncbi:MAG: DMT family transporter [Rhodobacteraceae bacterium]|nr:DMT family transporter [Paracoccaceae bacterium]